ncbi:hypothetical protein BKA64DRAFT_705925 [Cadophora sp. MPI-SDFR-AT-0126]|nr:hypothetical protein BKA64DRAFT_705925 [Leotiomycetes sp. MPI-SDFR-AT-0126]
MSTKFLPNTRLMARAFHRVPPAITTSKSTSSTSTQIRKLSTTSPSRKWEGSQPEEHATREKDSHNVQHDAVKSGKAERAGAVKEGEGKSRGASQKDGGSGERAKREFPEAPGVVDPLFLKDSGFTLTFHSPGIGIL